MDKKTRAHAWYAVLAVLGILPVQAWWIGHQQAEVMPYSQFRQLVQAAQELLRRETSTETELVLLVGAPAQRRRAAAA